MTATLLHQAVGLGLTWLREPLLLILWGVAVAAVLGAGRAAGLPLLFWHERKGHAFWAGLAGTLLTGEIFFVLFLVRADGPCSSTFDLCTHLAGGGALWLLVVAVGAVRLLRPAGVGVTPRPRKVVANVERLGHLSTVRISPWPFILGVALAAFFVAGWVLCDRWIFGADRSPLHLHVMAAVVTGAIVLMFIATRRHATPAVGLCMLLAMFAATYGFITYRTGSRGLLVVVAFLSWWIAGRNRYRLRLPALDGLYPTGKAPGVSYPPKDTANLPNPALLLDRLITPNAEPGDWPSSGGPTKRPLVLVCVSGGGIRAAAWTAGVLGALDAKTDFRRATRMITGASGGMVGAAIWVARHASATTQPTAMTESEVETLVDCVAMDSLTATARRLFFHDIPMAFWPSTNRCDRGRALEDAWKTHVAGALKARLEIPFASLRQGEDLGQWPSLVFSPMLIEDGRRLIFSNLALDRLLRNEARWLEAGAIKTATSSVTAYHAAALFPGRWSGFPLSTAARLSASFPYVSGAVLLPTTPRRRIVDAGYYDNYGMDLACGWLREALACHRRWVAEHVSKILVVQIRDNVSDLSINPESQSEQQMAALTKVAQGGTHSGSVDGSALGRGLEGVSSPPEGLLAARDSVCLFRSDAQLQAVTSAYKEVTPVSTAVFEFKGEASLSWYLTAEERTQITAQLATTAILGKVTDINTWLTVDD